MEGVLLQILYNALILLATLVAGFLVAYLRKRLGVEGMKRIETELALKWELAALAVRFVEQVYRDLEGEEKYTQAALWLVARADEVGLRITTEEVKGLIEAALRTFKDEFGEHWAKQVTTGAS